MIENALRDAGIEPTVISSDDAIAGATPLVHATSFRMTTWRVCSLPRGFTVAAIAAQRAEQT